MDFERLERAWSAAANSPSEAAGLYVAQQMMETLKKRRQSLAGFTVLLFIVLALWTAKIGYDILFQPFPFDVSREWGALVLLGLPWLSWLIVRLSHQRHVKAHPNPFRSVPATLRGLIDENAAARRRTIFMALATVAFTAATAFTLGQLHAVGKMNAENIFQFWVLFGVIFGGIWLYYGLDYFRRLRPEGEHLRRLLAAYSPED